MPAARRARDEAPGGPPGAGGQPPAAPAGLPGEDTDAGTGAGGRTPRTRALSRAVRSPAGLAIAVATVLALALRLFLVTRPGFLTSGTVEYDDGVYLGAAMRLLHGALPYKDYAFVQPPGIIVVAPARRPSSGRSRRRRPAWRWPGC